MYRRRVLPQSVDRRIELRLGSSTIPVEPPDSALCHPLRRAGFTLLELIVVIAVISTLLCVAMVRAGRLQTSAKEVALKQNLYVMRQAIEQFVLERQTRPQSLDDLVSAGYLGDVPVDPFTRQRDWQVETVAARSDPKKSSTGIVDIHSSSRGVALDGAIYSSW